MNKALAAVLAIAFIAVCAVMLLRQPTSVPATASVGAATAKPQPTAAPADSLVVTAVSGFTKKTWFDQAVAAFNGRGHLVDGKPVIIKASYANSGDVLRGIQDGTMKPELWSPADASWFKQANDWSRGQSNRDLFSTSVPLVHVPLVIAMWEPMAKALGWPQPIGWADLAKLSIDEQGWARYGHPEWGRFTWGHCHPDSASGFQTMVCMAYAITGKTSGLTVADLKDAKVLAKLTELESSVEHYGMSSRWIDEFMRSKGPAYLSAAAQYENNIIEGNLASGGKPWPLVAIYPKEGTIYNDNPIATADADWVTPADRQAAELFTTFLLSSEQQHAAIATGLRPIGDAAPGGPFTSVNGVAEILPAIPSFEVPGDAILNRIRDLWFETKKPASVTLVLDTSGSMKGDPMEKAKAGAIGFLEQMYPKDEVEVIAFSDRIVPLCDMGPVSSVREQLRERIGGLFSDGGTHLYDVTEQALQRIGQRRAKDPRRHYGIVLLTDGKDEGSRLSKQDLMDQLPRNDAQAVVKIFTIAYGQDIDKNVLKEMANRTNARMYESTAKNILQVYSELVANF